MMVESMNAPEQNKIKINIPIICPTCQKKKNLTMEKGKIHQTNRLTTVSIPEGFVCEHHFQAFVDKNYKVRGYQKVDFQIEVKEKNENIEKNENKESKDGPQDEQKSDEILFKEALFEGNYVEWTPKHQRNSKENKKMKTEESLTDIKQIYENFWDIIDDNNEIFHNYIEKDKERRAKRKNWLRSEISD